MTAATHRPDIEEAPPTLVWPDQRGQLPTRCPRPHCGGTVLRLSRPNGTTGRGGLVCFLCSRTLVVLVSPPRPSLTGDDARPKRGRPPKTPPPSNPSRMAACARCGHVRPLFGKPHCRPCIAAEEHAKPCSDCGERPKLAGRHQCQPCRQARRKAMGW